jgi:hypothetical protein
MGQTLGGSYYVEGTSPADGGSFEDAFNDAFNQLQSDELEEIRRNAARDGDGFVRLHVIEMYARWENPLHDYKVVLGIDR